MAQTAVGGLEIPPPERMANKAQEAPHEFEALAGSVHASAVAHGLEILRRRRERLAGKGPKRLSRRLTGTNGSHFLGLSLSLAKLMAASAVTIK